MKTSRGVGFGPLSMPWQPASGLCYPNVQCTEITIHFRFKASSKTRPTGLWVKSWETVLSDLSFPVASVACR